VKLTKSLKNIAMKEINELTGLIIGQAIEVHRRLGPGLLESTYRDCLLYELESIGLDAKKEIMVPLIYKEIKLDHGYRIDILVDNRIVVELKTVEAFNDVHYAQILTYMKLGNFSHGLLINFNVTSLRQGLKRFINTP
jgi:GxxExxY protein